MIDYFDVARIARACIDAYDLEISLTIHGYGWMYDWYTWDNRKNHMKEVDQYEPLDVLYGNIAEIAESLAMEGT